MGKEVVALIAQNCRTIPQPQIAAQSKVDHHLGEAPFRDTLAHLIIPLTQELEPLGSFVHEDPI